MPRRRPRQRSLPGRAPTARRRRSRSGCHFGRDDLLHHQRIHTDHTPRSTPGRSAVSTTRDPTSHRDGQWLLEQRRTVSGLHHLRRQPHLPSLRRGHLHSAPDGHDQRRHLGATIYYTTNGTTPTTSSHGILRADHGSATETLRAIAMASGYSNSAVGSAAYTIIRRPRRLFTRRLGHLQPRRRRSRSVTPLRARRSTTPPTAPTRRPSPRCTPGRSPSAPPRPCKPSPWPAATRTAPWSRRSIPSTPPGCYADLHSRGGHLTSAQKVTISDALRARRSTTPPTALHPRHLRRCTPARSRSPRRKRFKPSLW